MGVRAGSGAGAQRRPSHAAYFVALGGILALLLALCCYFIYFCVTRVKELSRQDLSQPARSATPAPAPPVRAPAYPVQPGVRDTATAMARLCHGAGVPLPAASGKGTVFPAHASPAAQRAHTHGAPRHAAAAAGEAQHKLPAAVLHETVQAVR